MHASMDMKIILIWPVISSIMSKLKFGYANRLISSCFKGGEASATAIHKPFVLHTCMYESYYNMGRFSRHAGTRVHSVFVRTPSLEALFW